MKNVVGFIFQRNRLLSLLLSMFCSSCFAGSLRSFSPSYSCQNTNAHVERLICSSPQLSYEDRVLDGLYKKYLKLSKNPDKFIIEQKRWLKDERNTCKNIECLNTKYSLRVEQVNLLLNRLRYFSIETVAPAERKRRQYSGKYYVSSLKDAPNEIFGKNHAYCNAFVENLNNFRRLGIATCNSRLSTKYSRFSRPQWAEIPLDYFKAREIIGRLNGGTMGDWIRWLELTNIARKKGVVKMWRYVPSHLHHGSNMEIIRLDHAINRGSTYCKYYDSEIAIFSTGQDGTGWTVKYLGNDFIYDSSIGKYFSIAWDPNGLSFGGYGVDHNYNSAGGGLILKPISSTYVPACRVDWVPAK